MSALWELGNLGSSGILYLLTRVHTRAPTASSHSPTHCYVLQTSSLQLTMSESETYLFYDPKLLSPSSKAGSDYVPNPSQYKEMVSNYRRHQTRALAAAANKANDTNTKHESNSDCESDSNSFQSLGDRAAAAETNSEFPVSVLGEHNTQPQQTPEPRCDQCETAHEMVWAVQEAFQHQFDITTNELEIMQDKLRAAESRRDAALLRLKQARKALKAQEEKRAKYYRRR
ncbi:hypothetical protein K438DRAFT_1830756 [Mycena galopus ATCC 62051]|nr:hypothetical protein K438DRAFT_1830756 [Mycena galopus ATCC 62051]